MSGGRTHHDGDLSMICSNPSLHHGHRTAKPRGRDMALMLFMAAPTLDQGSNLLTSTFWIRIQFTFYISIWKHKIVAEVNLVHGTFDFSDALGLRGQPNPNGYPITCIKLISLSKMNSALDVLASRNTCKPFLHLNFLFTEARKWQTDLTSSDGNLFVLQHINCI